MSLILPTEYLTPFDHLLQPKKNAAVRLAIVVVIIIIIICCLIRVCYTHEIFD